MSDLERLIAELSGSHRIHLARLWRIVGDGLRADRLEDPAGAAVCAWLVAGAPAREDPLEHLNDERLAALRWYAVENAGLVRFVEFPGVEEFFALAEEPPWPEPIGEVFHELAIACAEELDRRRRARRTIEEDVIVGPLEVGPGDDDELEP